MDSPSSEKKGEILCEIAQGVGRFLDSSGTALCLPLTFQQEGCPHYWGGLGGFWVGWGVGGGSKLDSETRKEGCEEEDGNSTTTCARDELKEEADLCSFVLSCSITSVSKKIHT